MSKVKWDEEGKRLYETGVSQCVLYVRGTEGYEKGVAWNGITAVTETPSGAEASPIYADDKKYLSLTSVEEFGGTIEAYTYPDEFAVCDGSAELAEGILIGQQSRTQFGLVYKTKIGNDVLEDSYGYKLHVIYGAKAAPSERAYATINDSPEAITFSWEFTTTAVEVVGHKPTSILTIDSTKVSPEALEAIEEKLFGGSGEPTLLMPDEILELVRA